MTLHKEGINAVGDGMNSMGDGLWTVRIGIGIGLTLVYSVGYKKLEVSMDNLEHIIIIKRRPGGSCIKQGLHCRLLGVAFA